MTTNDPTEKKPPCDCDCHTATVTVVCCRCHATRVCDCGQKRRCCGEPPPPPPPGTPKPPGWQPGDKPPTNPFAGLTNEADIKGAFTAAVLNLVGESGTPHGPHFGPRKDEYLPYLVVRAFGGDHGARPTTVAFWESPDIFIAPNLPAEAAPPLPTTRGGLAQANAPNTLWAHVWNLGHAPVFNARVEFYWLNPSVGMDAASAHLIGVAYVDLGDRASGRAHTVVKCPTTWVPQFLNGGHECLVVRCFEPLTDPTPAASFAAWDDRHVAQRNIHVADASSPATAQIALRLGCGVPPGPATLEIVPAKVADVGWLAVLEGRRNHGLRDAASVQEIVGLMHPTLVRDPSERPTLAGITANTAAGLLRNHIDFERGCDELEAIVYVHVDGLQPGECRAYRVQQSAGGQLVGGFTIVVRNEPAKPARHRFGSTSFIQSTAGVKGDFEVVVPLSTGGFAHFRRGNDDDVRAWTGPTTFATGTKFDAVSMIQSSFGNLELVVRIGDRLGHFYRDAGTQQWNGPDFFASGASGTPSFIQGHVGTAGTFEVVTPLASGGMARLSRNNQTLVWSRPEVFGTDSGTVDDVSLIQENPSNNLQLAARMGDRLALFTREAQGWNGRATVFASGVSGTPSLIQGRFGTPGNFELAAPLAAGGMMHVQRDSQTLAWSQPALFGSGTVDSLTLIQSNFDKNLEVVAMLGTSLVHFWRESNPPWQWRGPFLIAAVP